MPAAPRSRMRFASHSGHRPGQLGFLSESQGEFVWPAAEPSGRLDDGGGTVGELLGSWHDVERGGGTGQPAGEPVWQVRLVDRLRCGADRRPPVRVAHVRPGQAPVDD
jgi:hypothetical protein